MRALVVVGGDCASGLEIELGGADCVVYEEDFGGASVEDVEASGGVQFGDVGFFVLAEGFVLQVFDGYVAEWFVG